MCMFVCFHIVDLYLIFAMSLGLFPFFFGFQGMWDIASKCYVILGMVQASQLFCNKIPLKQHCLK